MHGAREPTAVVGRELAAVGVVCGGRVEELRATDTWNKNQDEIKGESGERAAQYDKSTVKSISRSTFPLNSPWTLNEGPRVKILRKISLAWIW